MKMFNNFLYEHYLFLLIMYKNRGAILHEEHILKSESMHGDLIAIIFYIVIT